MHLLARREGQAQSIIMALCTQCSGCDVAFISPQTDPEILYPINIGCMMSGQTLRSECQLQDTKCSQVMVFVL